MTNTRKIYKAEMWDKMQYLFRAYYNRTMHAAYLVTHDTEIVKKMKKRTILLDAGRILKDYKKGTYKHESSKNSK